MAQLVLFNRFSSTLGNLDIVLEDDDPAHDAGDPTPRTTTAVRLFSRGDLAVLRNEPVDILMTRTTGGVRRIVGAIRVLGTQHASIDLTSFNVRLNWPLDRARPYGQFDFRFGTALGENLPESDELFDTYRVKLPKTSTRAKSR